MVKTIFKVIVGTIVLIVGSSLILEWYNIQTTGLQLGSIAKMSARQACVYFGQETYKRDDFTGIDADTLYDSNGVEFMSGNFYSSYGTSTETIYNSLYGFGSNFLNGDGKVLQGYWESLDLLAGKRADPWGMGEFFRDAMMTPLNMGVPYLERDVVDKIFKWNLASILNNGQLDGTSMLNVHTDEVGRVYVLYKGFRVFVSEAEITDITYNILDLRNADDAELFKEYTNMDAGDLTVNISDDAGIGSERNFVAIAGISYSVPMQYEGITPMKRIMEYAWSQEVEGMNNSGNGGSDNTWNSLAESELEQGGFSGSSEGVLPVPGRLVYYIIR